MRSFFEDFLSTRKHVGEIALADSAVSFLEVHGDLVALTLKEGSGALPKGRYDLSCSTGHAALHQLLLGALLADSGPAQDLILRDDLSKDGCFEDGLHPVEDVLGAHLVDTLAGSLRCTKLSLGLVVALQLIPDLVVVLPLAELAATLDHGLYQGIVGRRLVDLDCSVEGVFMLQHMVAS